MVVSIVLPKGGYDYPFFSFVQLKNKAESATLKDATKKSLLVFTTRSNDLASPGFVLPRRQHDFGPSELRGKRAD